MLNVEEFEYFRKRVEEWRNSLGLVQNDPLLHKALFLEEFRELVLAKSDVDKADAIIDMIVVYYGMYQDTGLTPLNPESFWGMVNAYTRELKFDLIKGFDVVMESLESKLCPSEAVMPTTELYEEMGVDARFIFAGKSPEGTAVYRVIAMNDTDYAPAGKLLKPVTYQAPQWHKVEFGV